MSSHVPPVRRTHLGTGTNPFDTQPPPSGSHVRPKGERCPRCAAPFGDRPFCAHDGELSSETFVIGARYQIEELLGAGGMAFVFGGRHTVLGKRVAVKVLRPELSSAEHAQRFLREARLAGQIHHENIVAVTDFGHDDALGLHYLVMDRLKGESLAEVLEAEQRIPWARAVPILLQLARALGVAHDQGVVHRDITPRNIVLEQSSGRRDVVKLCDFGVSRTPFGGDRVTKSGEMVGAPAYMAPEQLRGQDDPDAATDVYALGTVAYEMLSGALPYTATSPVAMIAAKLRDPVTSLLELRPLTRMPRELDSLVLRCLSLDPMARPTAREVEAELSRLSLHTASDVEPTDLVGSMIGSYRVRSLIGTGGMGWVYRAIHPQIGTEVAIKVLLPEVAASSEVIQRFAQEARASSAIGSPHIPKYYDFGTLSDGRAYAVMELLEGETVGDKIARVGPLPLAEVVEIVEQAAEALRCAHVANVIHRDVKPDNIFLAKTPEGGETVKVLDFGIAKALTRNGTQPSTRLTQVGTFIGTPAYCAPEQMYGGAVGPETDVYALAATTYEMLTGCVAFDGDVAEVFAAKSKAIPSVSARIPGLPSIVDATITCAMAYMPEDRFASMDELREAVRGWLSAPADVAQPLPPPPPDEEIDLEDDFAPPMKSRPSGVLVGLAVIGSLALAGAALWLRPVVEIGGGSAPVAVEPARVEGALEEATPPTTESTLAVPAGETEEEARGRVARTERERRAGGARPGASFGVTGIGVGESAVAGSPAYGVTGVGVVGEGGTETVGSVEPAPGGEPAQVAGDAPPAAGGPVIAPIAEGQPSSEAAWESEARRQARMRARARASTSRARSSEPETGADSPGADSEPSPDGEPAPTRGSRTIIADPFAE
jgi:serine/threonine protein kinase